MLIYKGSIMWYFINAKGDENMEKPFSFYLVTDTHYFDGSFKRTGEAYEKRSITDQNVLRKRLQ